MPVIELLNNHHQRSNLLLAPRPCNIQSRTPPTQSPNCTFRKRYNLFRSRTKRHLQFNDWTKAHFDSRCVPRCFEPGQRIFQLVYGDLFETNLWAKHIPDTLARRRYDSSDEHRQGNLSRLQSAANESWENSRDARTAREISISSTLSL